MPRAVEFGLESLKLLDMGKINEAFKLEMAHVIKDCKDRPHEDKERVVNIGFKFVPDLDPNDPTGSCDKVKVACDIKSSIPTRKTRIYEMRVHADDKLSFHPDLPDEPHGSTLYDDQNRKIDRNTGEIKDDSNPA